MLAHRAVVCGDAYGNYGKIEMDNGNVEVVVTETFISLCSYKVF